MSNLVLRIDGGPHKGRQIWIQPGQVVRVGSSARCDCHLSGAYLSEEHFEVTLQPSGAFLKALDAALTVINGQVVQQGVVRDGDQIVAGTVQFSIELDGLAQEVSPHDSVAIPEIGWRLLGNNIACLDIDEPPTFEGPFLHSFVSDGFWLATAAADLPAEIAKDHEANGGFWIDQIAVQPFENLSNFDGWGQRWSQNRVIGIVGTLGETERSGLEMLSAMLAEPDRLFDFFEEPKHVVGLTFLANMKAILLPTPSFRLLTMEDRQDSLFPDGMFIQGNTRSAGGKEEDIKETVDFDPYAASDFGGTPFDSVTLDDDFHPDQDLNW